MNIFPNILLCQILLISLLSITTNTKNVVMIQDTTLVIAQIAEEQKVDELVRITTPASTELIGNSANIDLLVC